MTTVSIVTRKALCLVYDGTNAEQLCEVATQEPNMHWTVGSEVGGVLTLGCDNSAYDDVTVEEGQVVIVESGSVWATSQEIFDDRYQVLGSA